MCCNATNAPAVDQSLKCQIKYNNCLINKTSNKSLKIIYFLLSSRGINDIKNYRTRTKFKF